MINLRKNINKKVIIFDLDGVLINSKDNMQKAWLSVQKNFNLHNIKFDDYFSKIGKPFKQILLELNINKNHKKIKECYDNNSKKNVKLIKFYRNVKSTLNQIHLNGHQICIVTSKDKLRTKFFLKDILNFFCFIQCPQRNLKGKPYPDQIENVIKKLKVSKKNCIYVGDTDVDYLAAKKANIQFIFASWGYGEKKKYEFMCNNIKEINKYII